MGYNAGEVYLLGISGIVDHHPVPTPNWFYYYSQAVTAPWGYVINYRPPFNGDTASVYFPGQDHVHIGDNAHGRLSTNLFAIAPGSPFVQQVGSEFSLGIDTFARVVYHECTHKKLEELIENGALDTDSDGVPDSVEIAAGLNPANKESIRGWKAVEDPDTESSADNEIFCRMTERGNQGDIDQDWADNGLNWYTPPTRPGALPVPPNRCNRNPQFLDGPFENVPLIWKDAQAALS